MRIGFFIFLAIILSIDIYVFFGIRQVFNNGSQRAVSLAYFLTTLLTIIGIANFFYNVRGAYSQTNLTTNILFGLAFTFIITKFVLSFFLLGEDVFRIAKLGVENIFSGGGVALDSRRKFIGQLGLAIAALPFTSFLYGITKGKYHYKIHNISLSFRDLPEAFDGFKVVQISDIHSGSFDSKSSVKKGLDMIQEQNPDLILFTGDLVNNYAEEIEPYIDIFSELKATHGKFSILGNHDYAEYVRWPSKEAHQENMDRLFKNHDLMGFKLLNNDSVLIKKENTSIRLGGVENWGAPPFPQRGDLKKAFETSDDQEFKILMSHDPSHWDLEVLDFTKKVHLTLSGHTHGMQMGIEIPGIKWSPVKYRYPRWAGIYEQKGRFLNVNRGFGFLGFPGRAGIWPEISVIELKRA